jgi:RNA polymerase sigma factor (sigma-70 family)
MADPGGDDRTLLLRVRAGDDDAFTELYERHVGPVRRLAWALTRNAAEAEDLVAESFFRVLRVVRRGRGPVDNARPYLLTVARRVASEWSSNRSEIPVEDVTASGNAPLDENDGSAGVELEMLARAFKSLPPRWQRVLWHVEVEGEGPSSVAPILGLTPNATAALAHRAREGLRAAYVQAHLREQERPLDCQPVVAKLGAFAVGRLRRRDATRVRAHLAWCPSCRELHAELDEVGAALRADLGVLLAAAGVLAGVSGQAAATVGALASGATSGAASSSGIGAVSSGAAAASVPVAVPTAAATSAVAVGGMAVGVKSLVVAASVAAVGLFGFGGGESGARLVGPADCVVSCSATVAQSAAVTSTADPAGPSGPGEGRRSHGSEAATGGSDESRPSGGHAEHTSGGDHPREKAKHTDHAGRDHDDQAADTGPATSAAAVPTDSGRRGGWPSAGRPPWPPPAQSDHAGHGVGPVRPGDHGPAHGSPPRQRPPGQPPR